MMKDNLAIVASDRIFDFVFQYWVSLPFVLGRSAPTVIRIFLFVVGLAWIPLAFFVAAPILVPAVLLGMGGALWDSFDE